MAIIFVSVMSLVASIFSLILIACDRFFGIVFAMKAHIIERKASHSIVLLWICSIAVAVPMLVVRDTDQVQWRNHVEIWCDDTWPAVVTSDPDTGHDVYAFPGRKAYYTILTVVLYFLPMFLMSCVYFIIIVTVWFSRSPGERVRKEVKLQGRVKRKVSIVLKHYVNMHKQNAFIYPMTFSPYKMGRGGVGGGGGDAKTYGHFICKYKFIQSKKLIEIIIKSRKTRTSGLNVLVIVMDFKRFCVL